MDDVAGIGKVLDSDRSPHFQSTASKLRYPHVVVPRVEDADPGGPSPAACGPAVGHNQPCAGPHRRLRIHEIRELTSIGGGVEGVTPNKGEPGREPEDRRRLTFSAHSHDKETTTDEEH